MLSKRRLDALKALAERPGTPAEGELAKSILERHKEHPRGRDTGFDTDKFISRMEREYGPFYCECGDRKPWDGCRNVQKHEQLREQIKKKFPPGTRVFYNYWAYEKNCPGTVAGPGRTPARWNWLRIKFDRLKTAREVPVYSRKGLHLFTEPQPDGVCEEMRIA